MDTCTQFTEDVRRRGVWGRLHPVSDNGDHIEKGRGTSALLFDPAWTDAI
jgi:hypothetical protein